MDGLSYLMRLTRERLEAKEKELQTFLDPESGKARKFLFNFLLRGTMIRVKPNAT